jgi:integrase
MYRERKLERFLSEPEMARAAEGIAAAERAGKIGPHAAAGLRLALLTGARSGEITAAQWDHVDWQRKLIRLPDSKTNEPRTIHLSDAALEVLHSIPRILPTSSPGRCRASPIRTSGGPGLSPAVASASPTSGCTICAIPTPAWLPAAVSPCK